MRKAIIIRGTTNVPAVPMGTTSTWTSYAIANPSARRIKIALGLLKEEKTVESKDRAWKCF